MFIEKKKKKHTDPGRTGGEVPGEGPWELHVALIITLVNEAAGAGHGAACPLAPAIPYRMTQVDKQGH